MVIKVINRSSRHLTNQHNYLGGPGCASVGPPPGGVGAQQGEVHGSSHEYVSLGSADALTRRFFGNRRSSGTGGVAQRHKVGGSGLIDRRDSSTIQLSAHTHRLTWKEKRAYR